MSTEELIENNMGLVVWIINTKNLYIPNHMKKDMRDIYQEGYVLLTQAAKNFDETKGFKFSTYATNCIYLGLRSFIDRYGESRYNYQGFSLENEVFKNDEEESISWKDYLEEEEEGFGVIEILDFIKKSNVKDIEIITKLRANGLTYEEIGSKLKVSEALIRKRLKKFREESQVARYA